MPSVTFADAVKEIIGESSAQPERLTPSRLCDRVARETQRYLDRVQFSADRYMRHPIVLWDDWEVMLIAWRSGQVTPIHDHRGVMGGMVVLSGALVEERFTTPISVRRSATAGRAPRETSRTSVRRSSIG